MREGCPSIADRLLLGALHSTAFTPTKGVTAPAIVRELERDGAPLPPRCSKRRKERVHSLMSNETYRGTYWYGKSSWVTTEEGTKVTRNPKDTWIGVPFPPLVDEETWERERARKFKRFSHSKRNTKTFYLLQHTVKCAECGLYLGGRAVPSNCQNQNGKRDLCKVYPPAAATAVSECPSTSWNAAGRVSSRPNGWKSSPTFLTWSP